MNRAGRAAAAACRAVLGGLAGGVLAVIGLCLLGDFIHYYPPDDGYSLLLTTAGVGTAAGALLGLVAGAWAIRGMVGLALRGVVAGSLLGLLGGVLFGVVAAPSDDPVFWGKHEAVYQRAGILLGVPAGCLLGGVIGLAAGVVRRRRGDSF